MIKTNMIQSTSVFCIILINERSCVICGRNICEDESLFDFTDYHVKGDYYSMKTMTEDLINYGKAIGKLESAVNNVKNLMDNTGWTAEVAMTMSGISDELKPKILEELSKINE